VSELEQSTSGSVRDPLSVLHFGPDRLLKHRQCSAELDVVQLGRSQLFVPFGKASKLSTKALPQFFEGRNLVQTIPLVHDFAAEWLAFTWRLARTTNDVPKKMPCRVTVAKYLLWPWQSLFPRTELQHGSARVFHHLVGTIGPRGVRRHAYLGANSETVNRRTRAHQPASGEIDDPPTTGRMHNPRGLRCQDRLQIDLVDQKRLDQLRFDAMTDAVTSITGSLMKKMAPSAMARTRPVRRS
jgi:hypothetical protein